ncbi:MAG: hypothetical protein KDC98_07090 [Planctomycetes bacterium]|nr:hypothetical protein [Planctomycetota bacterium]
MKLSLTFASLALFAIRLDAQCANAWAAFGALPGVDYVVNAATSWDPDGPGPMTQRAVVGGRFGVAGGIQASAVAAWDPLTGQWSALGAGPNGLVSVDALLALPSGDLIAGGAYSSAGTITKTLARWNGTAWTPFGGALSSTLGVNALTWLPNGDIAVGGDFTAAGTTPLPYIGVWNGTSWSSLGGGMNGPVLELSTLPNGDLIALGAFTIAGGVAANGIARWNGTAWTALGAGLTGSVASSAAQGEAAVVLPNGDLIVGGVFTQAGGTAASNVAYWNGTSWSALGGGITGSGSYYTAVHALARLPNGELIAGGYFTGAGGAPIPNIARWNGSSWSSLGAGTPSGMVNKLAILPSGELLAGGAFTVAGNVGATFVARWNGTAWSSLGGGTAPSGAVRSLLTMPDGTVMAGGVFRAAGGLEAHGIAHWDGATWSSLGGGCASGSVGAMTLRPNGDLIAGGYGLVSSWDGAAWTHLPAAMTPGVPHADGVEALAVLANGDIVVGGDFATIDSQWISGLARWNGTAWSMLGGQAAGEIHAMTTLSNGDLVVGGDSWWLPAGAEGVARWDGSSWSSVGTGLQPSTSVVHALAPLANGAFLAGGSFTQAGTLPVSNIAMWNGTAWSALGSGTNGLVRRLHVLPNGDVIAAGQFTQAGGVAVPGIARWNGAAWSPVGSGQQSGLVLAIAAGPEGDLLVGGSFATIGGQVSPHLARLVTTCPATAQRFGSGCTSSGGLVDLRATSLPWLGATFRSRATGLPANAIAAVAYGLQSSTVPLGAVVSPTGAGCRLWQSLDLVSGAVPIAGGLDIALAIPDVPALIGMVLHQQVGVAELQGATVLEWTSSNRLTLVLGRF